MEEKNTKSEKELKLEEMKNQINILKGKASTLESNIKTMEKETEEAIGKMIYEKRKGLERSYGEVLKEAEQRLKAKEKEKVEERKKNIEKVVKENTKETREGITYLKNHIKNVLKENNIPSFVNSTFYMGVWCPSTVVEWCIRLLVIAIVLLIPTIISFVVAKDNLITAFPNAVCRYIIIALIYFGVIFIASLIWLLVDKMTKKNIDVLNEVKEFRKNILDNNKKIAEITKKTNEEMTDDKFDYTKIDRDIEAGKLEVENYKKKKEEAITHFETVTEEEIKKNAKSEMEKKIRPIEREIDKVKEEIDELQKKHDELKLSQD